MKENAKNKVTYRQDLVDNDIILSVEHLKQYFGGGKYMTKAVNDVSFQIKAGECFGLVGESGCGKTTTGRSIIGLYDITGGSIFYKGYRVSSGLYDEEMAIKDAKAEAKARIKELKADPKGGHEAEIENIKSELAKKIDSLKAEMLSKEYDKAHSSEAYNRASIESTKDAYFKLIEEGADPKKISAARSAYEQAKRSKLTTEIQMIFQDPIDSLDPRKTVEDIIQEGLVIQRQTDRSANHKKVVEMLQKVGLIPEYASRYPHEFSGGQRQRIGIARALVMNPKFLICDEPISALDVSIRAQIINLLNDLKEELGLTIMFIAHDLSVVKYFCDTIAVMYFGNLVEKASSDELFKHPLHPYTKALLSAIPKPDPNSEKNRIRKIYKPSEVHDYSVDKPSLQEIVPGHFVLCNEAEKKMYLEEIAALDAKKEAE